MTQFVVVGLNGLPQGALCFLVASGFTLIFGLMQTVNLARTIPTAAESRFEPFKTGFDY